MTKEAMADNRPVVEQEPAKLGEYKQLVVDLTPHKMPQVPLSTTLADITAPIVFIDDTHGKTPVANILNYNDAQRLRDLKFTHYLIEGSAAVQPLLYQRGTVDLRGENRLSPIGANPSYINAIYNMRGRGFEVRAIDHPANFDYTPTKDNITDEERENFIHQQIKEVRTRGGRPIILFGGLHTELGLLKGKTPSVAQRLLNEGENVVAVRYNLPSQKAS